MIVVVHENMTYLARFFRRIAELPLLLLAVSSFLWVSCGGGAGSGPPPPPPPPPPTADFSVDIGAPNITAQQQGAYQIQSLAVRPQSGFIGTVDFSVSGLPSGVTILPEHLPSIVTTQATSLAFQLVASTSAAVGTSTITITGTSGPLTHSVPFTLTVRNAAPFTIKVSPASISLVRSTTRKATISVTGTTRPLSVQVSEAPSNSGVNVAQTTSLEFLVQAGALAQPLQNYPITVTATDTTSAADSNVAVVPLTITVPPLTASLTRSNFARTDQSPTGIVYDQVRRLLFVSVEILNEVVVYSSVDGRHIATIDVPYPAGIDEAEDGSAVYVVSPFFSSITTIDPTRLEVVRSTRIPQISKDTIQTGFQVATLSNGKVMILLATQDPVGPPIYIWDPITDVFTGIGQRHFISFGQVIARSADHSKVLISRESTSGSTLFLYDVTRSSLTGPLEVPGHYQAINPDGSQIASVGLQSQPTIFYDDQFVQLGMVALSAFPIAGAIYSLDGTRLYVLHDDMLSRNRVASAINAQNFALAGVVPGVDFRASIPFSGLVYATFAIDESNVIFGPWSKGVMYLDASSPSSLSLPFSSGAHISPTLANVTGPTQALMDGIFSSAFGYDVYFGPPPASPAANKATNTAVQSSNSLGFAVPAGPLLGPVNATLVRSDGFFQVLPDAVSYGPSVLAIDPNAGSASGNNTIEIVGYGFDSSNVQVMVGGNQAADIQFRSTFGGQFPTQRLSVKTPSGPPGYADVTITTSDGQTTTIPNGFQYLASSEVYPLAGAFDDIAYDRTRQRLYISNEDHNRIEIFDLISKTYRTPIGVGTQPTSIALTPDGALLASLNSVDGTVSAIDLVSERVLATYPALTISDNGCGGRVLKLSPATAHRVLIDLVCTDALSGGNFHLISLDTGSFNCTGVAGCQPDGVSIGFGDGLAAMASTPDGSKIFLAGTSQIDGQTVGMLDLTSNTLLTGFSGVFNDAAANTDGTVFAASFGISDAQLSRVAIMAYEPYADSGNQSGHNVFGEKLNPSGSLLFVPQSTGVDIFDVHTGRLAQSVALPEPIPLDMNAMVLDETGTTMFLISNSGVTIAQLFQAPLSLASVKPASGASGSHVTVRGSGFQDGATLKFGDSQASVGYVDHQTLTSTVPTLSTGPVRVTVTNPDGHAYTLDAAFTVK